MLTMVTEVFGVRGKLGNLTIHPKLMKQQFDKTGKASIRLIFADKEFEVIYQNPKGLEYGEYAIKKAVCDNDMTLVTVGETVLLERAEIQGMGEGVHTITIELDIA